MYRSRTLLLADPISYTSSAVGTKLLLSTSHVTADKPPAPSDTFRIPDAP